MLSGRRPAQWLALAAFRLDRAAFYRDLAEMYRRGEAMLSFLEGEIANAQLTGQRSRARALRTVLQRLQGGEQAGSLRYLLAGVVPAGDAMLLLAVDRAADKPQALAALADAIDKQRAMQGLMLSYAALPSVTLPICAVLIELLARVILAVDESTPDYAREALWAGMNGWARDIAMFARSYGVVALATVGLAIGLVVASLPHWRGNGRLRVESWPIFGLYRDFQAGMLLSSLAMMLRTGETLQGSIEDIAQQGSLWMRWHLGRVLAALDENPNGTIDAFRRGLLSPYLVSRALTLSRSAVSFSEVLVQLGTTEADRVLRRVRRAAIVANLAMVSVFASGATFMGIASMTVPGQFATLMEPSSLMALKAQHDARERAAQGVARRGGDESHAEPPPDVSSSHPQDQETPR